MNGYTADCGICRIGGVVMDTEKKKKTYRVLGTMIYKYLLPILVCLLIAWAHMKRWWGVDFEPLASTSFNIAFAIVGIGIVGSAIGRVVIKKQLETDDKN